MAQTESGDTLEVFHAQTSSISVRGIYFPETDSVPDDANADLIRPCRTLAEIRVTEQTSLSPNEVSSTYDFFDERSETTFLSNCANGYDLPQQSSSAGNVQDWGKVSFMSKVKHTLYQCKCFKIDEQRPVIKLTTQAKEALSKIAHKLLAPESEMVSDIITQDIRAFFREFGSHVSTGPFMVGGRCVQKLGVSLSGVRDTSKKRVWIKMNEEFATMKMEDFDIAIRRVVEVDSGELSNECVELCHQFHLFGGEMSETDFQQWRDGLSRSNLVVSGVLNIEHTIAIWDMLSEDKDFQTGAAESLRELLQSTWSKQQHKVQLEDKRNTKVDNGNTTSQTGRNQRDSVEAKHHELLRQLKLGNTIFSMKDAMVLQDDSKKQESTSDVMMEFLNCLFTLDHRGRKCIELANSTPTSTPSTQGKVARHRRKKVKISSMDVTLAIMHSCDNFLRQELMWKMAECRLAVPVLLPDLSDPQKAQFQLWGLRKIYKSWVPRKASTPVEKSVVTTPIPIVSFVRFGKIPFSKSKLINRIMSKLQDHETHSYFVDEEEEPPCAKWSKGTIEACWFLPEGSSDERDSGNGNALLDAVTFFNLRGDALQFPKQTDFVCQASTLVVILTDESRLEESSQMIQSKIRPTAEHLLCIVCTRDPSKEGDIEELDDKLTRIFTSPVLHEIGEDICAEIRNVLWPSDDSDKPQTKSVQQLSSICKQIDIEVDEDDDDCIAARDLAGQLMESVYQSSGAYRNAKLPLQGDLWKEWVLLDRKWTKGNIPSEETPTIEHYYDQLRQQMLKFRARQRETEPDRDLVDFIEALKLPPFRRQYFMAWVDIYLTELTQDKLPPLRGELRSIRGRIRELNGKRRNGNSKQEESSQEMDALQRRAREISSKIDGSLGMEHFIREMGQLYEAYTYLPSDKDPRPSGAVIPLELPEVVADLLLTGYPFEVLDGDVGRVPIKWVEAVLGRVTERIGDARVYTIAALGIQSSGKSTLLNSMFGVRFAVSAGRCTRGVFMQLLEVGEGIRQHTRCDYVIVIDTEGLMAPELSNRDHTRHDNELATFSLCLADLTIINIAGQTIGRDLTDVLQIAAHAFIRMKRVNIKSSCRIIQQFVADPKAVDTNEEGTQAIFTALDNAVEAAAKHEGYEDIYTEFSDVFNFRRNEDVQYIPSLWQGAMAPPNYRYSEKVRRLRRLVIQDMKSSRRTFKQFSEHISNVWNAVKEENFIFSFQTCVIALRYKNFQHEYSKRIGVMRQRIIDWKSNAKWTLKHAEKDGVDNVESRLRDEIVTLVEEEGGKVEKFILQHLRENEEFGDGQLLQFEVEFKQDLKETKANFALDARSVIDSATESIAQVNDILLPECKIQLRAKARSEAAKPRHDGANSSTPPTNDQIDQQFEVLFGGWVDEICEKYPPEDVTEDEVKREFETYVVTQGEKKDVAIGLKRKLGITESGFKRSTRRSRNISQTVDGIIQRTIGALKGDIDKDLAFDHAIIQKLVDAAINALNEKHEGVVLTHDSKVNAIVRLCDEAVPIVFKGRLEYSSTHSLRALLESERMNLRGDYRALCTDAFQDERVSENLVSLFVEKACEVTRNELGSAIHREVKEKCPYLESKFTMFGAVLEDIAVRRDFDSYYRYIFELEEFIEKWLLGKVASICTEEHQGTSVIESMTSKIVEVVCKDLHCCIRKAFPGGETFPGWLQYLYNGLMKDLPKLGVSFEDVSNLSSFDVKDTTHLTESICESVANAMKEMVMQRLRLPKVGGFDRAEELLRDLPTKPHKEIKEHVTKGCLAQCPICHAPCDNLTLNHRLHFASLHYPEGVVGCVTAGDDCLAFSICNSSIATNEPYWDGQIRRKYCDHEIDFPDWVIQEVRGETPLNYWKWVMNTFNEDFARLYGREEAKLPEGWKQITQEQALEDLRKTCALR